jgi:hypothetical protein
VVGIFAHVLYCHVVRDAYIDSERPAGFGSLIGLIVRWFSPPTRLVRLVGEG